MKTTNAQNINTAPGIPTVCGGCTYVFDEGCECGVGGALHDGPDGHHRRLTLVPVSRRKRYLQELRDGGQTRVTRRLQRGSRGDNDTREQSCVATQPSPRFMKTRHWYDKAINNTHAQCMSTAPVMGHTHAHACTRIRTCAMRPRHMPAAIERVTWSSYSSGCPGDKRVSKSSPPPYSPLGVPASSCTLSSVAPGPPTPLSRTPSTRHPHRRSRSQSQPTTPPHALALIHGHHSRKPNHTHTCTGVEAIACTTGTYARKQSTTDLANSVPELDGSDSNRFFARHTGHRNLVDHITCTVKPHPIAPHRRTHAHLEQRLHVRLKLRVVQRCHHAHAVERA